MRVTAWRIVKTRHASRAFDGSGARIAGGRWNKVGVSMIYTADSLALAFLETIVHLPKTDLIKKLFCHTSVRFDSRLVKSLSLDELPADWDALPPSESTQEIGSEWVESNASVILKVPSTIIPVESNYLINPLHSDFMKLSIGNPIPFAFDPRVK